VPAFLPLHYHDSRFLIDRRALLVILDVENGRSEFPGRNLSIEQNINLTIRAVLELRKEEVRHYPADKGSTSPDVTAFACEVPSCGVKHLRGQIDHGNFRDIVSGTTNSSA